MLLTRVLVGAKLAAAMLPPIRYSDLPRDEQRKWREIAVKAATIAYDSYRFKDLKRWKNREGLEEMAAPLALVAGDEYNPDTAARWNSVAQAAAEIFLYCGNKETILPMLGRR